MWVLVRKKWALVRKMSALSNIEWKRQELLLQESRLFWLIVALIMIWKPEKVITPVPRFTAGSAG